MRVCGVAGGWSVAPDISGPTDVAPPVAGLSTGTEAAKTAATVQASGLAEPSAVIPVSPDSQPAPRITDVLSAPAEPEGALGTNETPTGSDGSDVLRVRLSLWVREHLVERSVAAGSSRGRAEVEETAQQVASWVSRQDKAVLAELEGLGAEQVLLRALAPEPVLSRTEPQQVPRAVVQMTLGI